jgi:hypothetical protein
MWPLSTRGVIEAIDARLLLGHPRLEQWDAGQREFLPFGHELRAEWHARLLLRCEDISIWIERKGTQPEEGADCAKSKTD